MHFYMQSYLHKNFIIVKSGCYSYLQNGLPTPGHKRYTHEERMDDASCFIFIRADTCVPPFQLGPVMSPTRRVRSWHVARLLAGSRRPRAHMTRRS
jgi:hypothetical protein